MVKSLNSTNAPAICSTRLPVDMLAAVPMVLGSSRLTSKAVIKTIKISVIRVYIGFFLITVRGDRDACKRSKAMTLR
ncbi:MAG: hypothetical protein EA377_04165 [Phycisphaerales bacterium]|nr:MAG: hypothetical protein EA377_04165 [Phycisphaerales bacterium]